MKLRTKLLGGFIIVALIATFIGVYGIINLKNADDSDTMLFERNTKPLGLLAEFTVAFQRTRVNVRENMVFTNDSKRQNDNHEKVKGYLKTMDVAVEELKKCEMNPITKKDFESILDDITNYEVDLNKMLDLLDVGKKDEAIALMDGSAKKAARAIVDVSVKMVEDNQKFSQNRSDQNTVDANKATMISIIVLILGVLIALTLGFVITINVQGQLGGDPLEVVEITRNVAAGNLSVNIKAEGKKPTSLIVAMDNMVNTIKNLVSDTGKLSAAAIAGKLDTRADTSKYEGEYKNLVVGINGTLDAVIGPLNVAAEYVDRISKGDIPPRITDEYKGDFNELKNNLNTCIDAVNLLVKDAKSLVTAAVEGKLDTRADASKHQGDFRGIVEGVNKTLDNVIGPLNVAAEYVDRISKGDIPPRITDEYKGDFNEIKNNLNTCIDAVNLLVKDAKMLATAAVEGKLDTRADASKHQGDFRGIVQGVNSTLDNVIGPLNVAAEYVDRISKGDIPPRITDAYNGDFNEIKNNLNTCIDAVNLLVKDAKSLVTAAVEGKLDTRADSSKHQGDFRGIVEGVNKTLDNVIGPLNMAAEYIDRISKGDIPPKITDEYKGDFNEIKNNVNVCIDAVSLLVKDAKDQSIAAIEGKLKTRTDASKHQGDFRAIIQGFNSTLDAVISPINESAGVLSDMAHGDLTKRMVGQYNGDMEEFKSSINQLGESLNNVLSEVLSSVSTTSAAAVQISATADGLAAASEEQSSQADEVASAVEEMSRTITENAMSASRTAEVAERNGAIAKEGGDVVEQTVTKMKDIADVVKKSADNIEKLGESSKEIGEIISVIDDIADQTNLLALNAAIEAARAGEQGRGFAVVADEVRKLAERTTEATKQIAKMIKGIQGETQEAVEAMKKGNEEVKSGISLADRAGKSLQEIVTSSRDVQDMISQIAAASEEQSSTSEEIAKNVSAISMVTNDSTKQIQEVASSADGLAKLTEQLQQMVGQFTLDNGGGMTSKNLGGRSAKHLTA